MPMMPTNGMEDPQGFGPGAGAQLGTGGYARMDAMGGDPTDPNASVAMQQTQPMSPTSMAEAMQQVLEQRQAEIGQQQEAERMGLLQQDIAEGQAFLEQMMQMVGQEATTADGGAAVPAGPMPEQAPPGGVPGGTGVGAAMTGLGQPMPPTMGGGAIPPEQLAALMGGA